MTLPEIFKFLGAPLNNVRWSWGAVRLSDGTVFLRVWQDECKRIDSTRYARVTASAAFEGRENNLGHVERQGHVERIRAGATTYMVMCIAKDPKADTRSIAKFIKDDIFVGGQLREFEGDYWLEIVDRRPIATARL